MHCAFSYHGVTVSQIMSFINLLSPYLNTGYKATFLTSGRVDSGTFYIVHRILMHLSVCVLKIVLAAIADFGRVPTPISLCTCHHNSHAVTLARAFETRVRCYPQSE